MGAEQVQRTSRERFICEPWASRSGQVFLDDFKEEVTIGCVLKRGQDSARETVGKSSSNMEQHVLRPRIRREGSA